MFGGNIIGLLFENSTPSMELEIKNRIEQSIETQEPRVTAVTVDVDFEEDQNDLQVEINYLILGIKPKFDNVSVIFKP